jgi:hypothetical protein
MVTLQLLNTQLTSLKLFFHEAMMHGGSFTEVKKIHLQIKELEKQIAEREILLLRGDVAN